VLMLIRDRYQQAEMDGRLNLASKTDRLSRGSPRGTGSLERSGGPVVFRIVAESDESDQRLGG
jgi:hypothetical protein